MKFFSRLVGKGLFHFLTQGLSKCSMRYFCLLVLLSVGAKAAQAGTLISFAAPQGGYVATGGGSFTATLQLSALAHPDTLHVTLGIKNVTALFQNKCGQAPCNITVALSPSTGVQPGVNYLKAEIRGDSSSVDQAQLRFTDPSGRQDSSDGETLGHFVAVRQTPTAPTSIQLVLDPNNATSTLTIDPCAKQGAGAGTQYINVVVLNRSTLSTISQNCWSNADSSVANALADLTQDHLIVINAAWGSGQADFSAMGGSPSKQNKDAYYAIGNGHGSPGTDFEAWQPTGIDTNHPTTVNGLLENFGCSSGISACASNQSAHVYVFRPTDAMGFAIIPGAVGASGLPTIYVGNPKSIPMNSNNPAPNQEMPTISLNNHKLFDYQTYTPNWSGDASGGIYLLVLNRSDLSLSSQNVYVTNGGSDDAGQISALATAISGQNSSFVYLLTTIGNPFNPSSKTAPLMGVLPALGVPASVLQATIPDYLGTPASPAFSMIGYYPVISGSALNSITEIGGTANSSNRTGPLKVYSSSANIQQGENGALRGVFAKGNYAYYEAQSLTSFSTSELPDYYTGDDVLSFALASTIGTTEPVAWPVMDTTGERNAYAYISYQLLVDDGIATSQCGSCSDIRALYTSSEASILLKNQPNTIPFSSEDATAANFTQADFSAVQAQLQLESDYLSLALGFMSETEIASANNETNVATALSSAGADITYDLEQSLGNPASKVGPTPIKMVQDSFALVGSLAGIIPDVAPLQIISGIANSASAILGFVQDAKTLKPVPDPYVTQLADLTQADTDSTESQTTKYSNDLYTGTNIFYNGVCSDWFRLQSVGLLASDQDYGGWLLEDAPTDRSAYLSGLTVSLRQKLYGQILPQYFQEVAYNSIATGSQSVINQSDANQTAEDFLSWYGGYQVAPITLKTLTDYSWDHRTTPTTNYCENYTFMFVRGKWGSSWVS
jgi:hypothetical protein